MIEEESLINRVCAYDPDCDKSLLKRAYNFAFKAHGDQLRASGDPYFLHPVEVASILIDLKLDVASIVTGFLHDTVEDTGATLEEIEALFGREVAQLVDGVTKLSKLDFRSEAVKQSENFQKLVLAMSHDLRVLLIKLADRLHNMRTLSFVKNFRSRQRIAKETLDIYAPLSERIGLQKIKDEMEDLAFSHLYPDVYDSLKNRLDFLYKESESMIKNIVKDLKNLSKEFGVNCQVHGRLKTLYSIWLKMQRKNISFDQLSDVMAFRMIVKDIPECYQMLGVIHSRYPMVPGRFRDYISTPKPNQYQSLHTGVIGPMNQRIEIQIRTEEMHQVCELGVAAHWQYKQGRNAHDGKQYAWLRSLLEILEHANNPEEFLEHTKLEMFQDQVFCFTPKGGLIALPKGATSVDFAYAIHSKIGDKTIGVKINGRQAPLRTPLYNGDQVDIITSENQTPSPTWERFVVTGKARSHIRKFIKNQQRNQFKELGLSILQKICLEHRISYQEEFFLPALKSFHLDSFEDFVVALGQGILTAAEIFREAFPDSQILPSKQDSLNTSQNSSMQSTLNIEGLIPGLATHYSGCCHPLPGDKIVGVVATGRGINIHTQDCESIGEMIGKDQVLDLSWGNLAKSKFTGRLKIIFENRQGALAAITAIISKHDALIINLKVTQRSTQFWNVIIDIEVNDLEHLKTLQASLRSIELVNFVERI